MTGHPVRVAGRPAGGPASPSSTPARGTVAEILGDELPGRIAAGLPALAGTARRAFKVDLAVRGGVPWTAEPARRAGTVHVGGTLEEIAEAEAASAPGGCPSGRSSWSPSSPWPTRPARPGDVHPVWAYAHVPTGWDGPGEQVVLDQLERFAPGLRDRVVATAVRTPADFEADNPNYVGGDIAGGANDLRQLVVRPRLAADPYATGVPGRLPVLVGHPAGRRRARDVRLPRRHQRARLGSDERADRLDAGSTWSGLVARLGPSRTYDVAYGVGLPTTAGLAELEDEVRRPLAGDVEADDAGREVRVTAGVLSVTRAMPARPSLSRVACSAVRATSRSRPIADMNPNASAAAHRCSKEW